MDVACLDARRALSLSLSPLAQDGDRGFFSSRTYLVCGTGIGTEPGRLSYPSSACLTGSGLGLASEASADGDARGERLGGSGLLDASSATRDDEHDRPARRLEPGRMGGNFFESSPRPLPYISARSGSGMCRGGGKGGGTSGRALGIGIGTVDGEGSDEGGEVDLSREGWRNGVLDRHRGSLGMSTRMAGRPSSERDLGDFFVAKGMSISRRSATFRGGGPSVREPKGPRRARRAGDARPIGRLSRRSEKRRCRCDSRRGEGERKRRATERRRSRR